MEIMWNSFEDITKEPYKSLQLRTFANTAVGIKVWNINNDSGVSEKRKKEDILNWVVSIDKIIEVNGRGRWQNHMTNCRLI